VFENRPAGATSANETLTPNSVYTVCGAAWAGETDVTEIAVSTDGGRTWNEAELLDPVRRHVWRRWKFDWLTPKDPGQYTLLARAKDAVGMLQHARPELRPLRDQSPPPNRSIRRGFWKPATVTPEGGRAHPSAANDMMTLSF
jgi:hypothetical protein